MQATIGERLKAVERYLNDDDEFLATYGDGLTDAPLDEMVDAFRSLRPADPVPLGPAPVQRASGDHGRRAGP